MPELADAKCERYISKWDVRRIDAELIASEKLVADYFESAVANYGEADGKPQRMANWLTTELFRILYSDGSGTDLRSIADVKVLPKQLAALLTLVDEKVINPNTGKKVLEIMVATGDDPLQIVQRRVGNGHDTSVIDNAIQRFLPQCRCTFLSW